MAEMSIENHDCSEITNHYKAKFAKIFDEFLRSNEKFTHKYIADQTGFSIASISSWRNGIREPKISEVSVLADFFDVSLDVLTGRKDY